MTPENNSQQGAKWEVVKHTDAYYLIPPNKDRALSCLIVGKPDGIQQIIDALNEREALAKMLQQLVDHFGEYDDRDFPEPSHKGFCTSETHCDQGCATIAHMAEHNALIRKAKELLTRQPK